MMKKILTGLLLVILPISVFALNQKGAIPLTVGGGYYHFASKRLIENASIKLVEAGYNFSDTWGIEGLLGFASEKSRRSSYNGRHVSTTLFTVSAVYHFSPFSDAFQPYVLAGPGIIGLNPNGLDANNEGLFNAGIGVQYFPGKKMAFGIEGRGLYTFVGSKFDYMVSGNLTYMLNI